MSSSGVMSTRTTSVGLLEHAIGHGLAHSDAGNARDDVGEAFEMLDVERGPDVDAGRDQLLHVLPALGMAAFRRVGVSELVDDDQFRLARERRVDVEFGDGAAAIFDDAARQHLEALEQGAGLGAPMRLDQADDDVDPLAPSAAARPAASRRSCRRRAQRRGTPSAGRTSPGGTPPEARPDPDVR